MKKSALILLYIFLGCLLHAQTTPLKTVCLYPQGQNGRGIVENNVRLTWGPAVNNGLVGDETVTEHGYIRNVGDKARMEIYMPEKCNGLMVVNCPGGGYYEISSVNEGTRAAQWFLSQGVAVCNLIYRMPNGHHEAPLADVQNAFRYCRAHAREWGVKQIGVVGYSAGGHLAACASTMFVDDITRPDFTILLYPVITMEEEVTDDGTMKRLTNEDPELRELYSIENRVGAKCPPAILFHSVDDGLVSVRNSRRYHHALLSLHLKSRLYEFPTGGHGWGFSTEANSGHDKLGAEQREKFFTLLSTWLSRRLEQ